MKEILNKFLQSHSFYKYKNDLILLIIFIIFAGVLSINFGIERHSDTLNYHIYNPWAFLNDRYLTDLMPANIQSYFNPLLDIPYFLMVKYFNNYPVFVTFLWGISYAIFLFVIYKFSALIFKNRNKYSLTLYSVFMASGVNMVVRHVGWLSHDIFIADLVLIALYLIFKAFNNKSSDALVYIAGFLLGSAFGFKYTAIIFVLPIFITFIIFHNQFKNFKKLFSFLLLGSIIGFLITDGFWLVKLWQNFGNPVFPYFNWFFNSDLINTNNVFNVDFLDKIPKNPERLWFFPLYYNFDNKFYVLFITFILNLFTIPFIKKERFKEVFKIDLSYYDFILTFAFLSYIIWVKNFYVLRYYAPLIGFFGIIFVIFLLKVLFILNLLIKQIQNKLKISNDFSLLKYSGIYLLLILSATVFVFFKGYFKNVNNDKIIRVPIREKLMSVEDLKIPDDAVVLVQRPTAIVIPFQNPNAIYIGLNSSRFTKAGIQIYSSQTIKSIKTLLIRNKSKLYFIAMMPDNPEIYKVRSLRKIKKSFEEYALTKKSNIKGIYTNNAALLELNNLGINYLSFACHEIKSNLFLSKDTENLSNYRLYFCKVKLKHE